MKRVVVTDATFPSLDSERAAAETAGAQFAAHRCRSAEEVEAALAGADVAVVQFAPVGPKAIAGLAPGARLIRYGVGYNNIDIEAANRLGFAVAYVPDYCTNEVADHTAALALAALRKIAAFDGSVKAGRWAAEAVGKPMKPFEETTIGFLGFGRIGRAVRDRLAPFGFRFLVHDPMAGTASVPLDRLFAESDLLSLHAPSTPATRRIVNAAMLATMQPTAMIVNTARGDLIDETDLAAALSEGTIAGAALDVFESEPLPAGSPLRTAPNLILTPHAAWYSDAAIAKLQSLVADEIRRALRGEPPRARVPGSTAP